MKIILILSIMIATNNNENKWKKLAHEAGVKTDVQLFGQPIEGHVKDFHLKIDTLLKSSTNEKN